ncbi:MAG: MgtC/SapB family protein, partial [Candidatus Glassbacteria bacterium]|nr:MgtC/SapB family protein [Candidatus Glassbacteria bacterium]
MIGHLELTFELRFLIALGLGFLLGLEREASGKYRQRQVSAGVRTHSLISLYGFGCAWLSNIEVAFALPIGLLSIAAFAGIEYLARIKEGHHGWTSAVAVLITFICGALSLLTNIWLPLAIGIISAILLSEKT